MNNYWLKVEKPMLVGAILVSLFSSSNGVDKINEKYDLPVNGVYVMQQNNSIVATTTASSIAIKVIKFI